MCIDQVIKHVNTIVSIVQPTHKKVVKVALGALCISDRDRKLEMGGGGESDSGVGGGGGGVGRERIGGWKDGV